MITSLVSAKGIDVFDPLGAYQPRNLFLYRDNMVIDENKIKITVPVQLKREIPHERN